MIAYLTWIFLNLPRDASALQRAISALESEIATLDKSSGSPEYWLAGFTALVATGVAIEIVVLHLDHKKEMQEWHVCELIPAKPTLAKVGWEIASIILVTVGVVGELGTGLWISHIDGQLRIKSAELQSDSDQLLFLVETKRSELEASLINLAVCTSPRVLPRAAIRDAQNIKVVKSYIDPLSPRAGQKVFIEVVPDAEARRAALNIAQALTDANWDVQKPVLRFVDGLKDGVSVQPSDSTSESAEHSRTEHFRVVAAHDKAREAADDLVVFLQSYHWQALVDWALDSQLNPIRDEKILPVGAIRIQVGLYPPSMYETPPGAKEFAEAEAKDNKRREDSLKQYLAERDKERTAGMSPAEIANFNAENESWRAKTKALEAPYDFNPCRPMAMPSP